MARQIPVHAATVSRIIVMYRAYDRELVRLLSQERQVFANLNPGRRGGNRGKLTANFRRSMRLRIPRLVVTHSAPTIKDDARLCAGLRIRGQCLGFRTPQP